MRSGIGTTGELGTRFSRTSSGRQGGTWLSGPALPSLSALRIRAAGKPRLFVGGAAPDRAGLEPARASHDHAERCVSEVIADASARSPTSAVAQEDRPCVAPRTGYRALDGMLTVSPEA